MKIYQQGVITICNSCIKSENKKSHQFKIDSLTSLYTVLYIKSNPHNTYTLTILIHYNHYSTIICKVHDKKMHEKCTLSST